MNKAKWVILFLMAVSVAVPSYAVELTLGGFPSYMRTRIRYFGNATFLSTLDNTQAQALGFSDADDNIAFVDTRLRLTPQLVLSDAVTIRAQVDVFDNVIWGGATSALLGGNSTLVNSSITTGDRFRGALLVGTNAIDLGIGESTSTDDVQFFNVRMLHVDLVLPNNYGFMRIGRQPFDWGLGILANGGWDPLSDLGFVLDRFLYLKSWPLMKGTFTFVFVSDRFRQGQLPGFGQGAGGTGNSLETGSGDGYEGGAFALIYNQGPLTVGGYLFPYIHQTNFAGTNLNLNRFTLWAALVDYKTDTWGFVGEMHQAQAVVTGAQSLGFTEDKRNIDASNLIFAVRGEVYPGFPVSIGAVEFGWANGDNIDSVNDGGDFQGNVLAFSAAYNIDNLLFKHIIPNIYGLENSVINAFYVRGWMTAKLMDHVTFTPQVLVAWNEETQALVQPNSPLFPPGNNEVDRFLGAELEGTLSIEVVTGVNFDFIGSVVVPGSGLKDLFEQRAAIECNTDVGPPGGSGGCAAISGGFDAPSVPFAFQGRLLVYIDQFF